MIRPLAARQRVLQNKEGFYNLKEERLFLVTLDG